MKKRKSIPLALLCMVLALSACSRAVERELVQIEQYLEEHPDSALRVLEAIPGTELKSKSARGHFSLLYAAALDKCYVDTSDISIIEPAIDYYITHGSPEKKLKSWYYQGVAYYNKQDYYNAFLSFSRAEEWVHLAGNPRYTGLLYSAISDTYNKTHNFSEELRYVDLALHVFSDCQDDGYLPSTLSRKAQALINSGRYSEAKVILSELVSNPSIPADVLRTIKEDYAHLLLIKSPKEARKALDYFRDVLSSGKGLRNVNLWASYAYSLSACGYKQESDQVFSQLYELEPHDYSVIDIWKSAACELNGDYEEAFTLLQKSLSFQDSLLNISLSQASALAHRDYLALKNIQLQVEKRDRLLRLLPVFFLLIVAVVLLSMILRWRNERHKTVLRNMAEIVEVTHLRLKESEKKSSLVKNELSVLRNQIDSKEKALSDLRAEFARMYKTQFQYLGNLCETYLLANENKDPQSIVYRKVQEMIKVISSDSDGQKSFEKMIDRSLGNIMKHFRQEFPGHSEEDYRFVSYLFVGFDATTLCIIFKMPSVAAVYMKKSRIKKAIQESKANYRDKYLEMIG